uniref:Uncharacterized protein n=1 Tax=Romanomermis culicivorax TaxID=13658 RepID=A0A915JQD1_ROMCU
MDDVVIITEILKYFNFEELCIAERINPHFKSCIEWELHRLFWPATHAAPLRMMRSISSLEGIHLYANRSASQGSFDLILDQCPNLRYFSIDILNNAEQI